MNHHPDDQKQIRREQSCGNMREDDLVRHLAGRLFRKPGYRAQAERGVCQVCGHPLTKMWTVWDGNEAKMLSIRPGTKEAKDIEELADSGELDQTMAAVNRMCFEVKSCDASTDSVVWEKAMVLVNRWEIQKRGYVAKEDGTVVRDSEGRPTRAIDHDERPEPRQKYSF